jgi:hypothetical protein
MPMIFMTTALLMPALTFANAVRWLLGPMGIEHSNKTRIPSPSRRVDNDVGSVAPVRKPASEPSFWLQRRHLRKQL